MEWYSFLMNCQRTHRKDLTDTRSHRMFDYDCGTILLISKQILFKEKKDFVFKDSSNYSVS